MNRVAATNRRSLATFRWRILTAMMVVVFSLTVLGLYLAQRKIAGTAERDLRRNFQAELSWLHQVQELRHAALADRCRELVSKPRIHAALEDNALDLLYPTAKDELRDLMESENPQAEQDARSLHAKFYRFLGGTGEVLPPPNPKDVGELTTGKEAKLRLRKLPETKQIGYLADDTTVEGNSVDEIMALPIFSSETGNVISVLAIGFKPFELIARNKEGAGMTSGIWLDSWLHLSSFSPSARAALGKKIADAIATLPASRNSFTVTVDGQPQRLFFERLNPGSVFPAAYEVCLYPLADWVAQLHRIRWQIGSAGALLLFGGFVASHFAALRLARPVEALEIDSEKNRAERERAEAALESTSEELERTARYSADASHQLKSPVTALRAGIETLLGHEGFSPGVYDELSALLHQTHRLTGVIDDLLLLSRLDAGHLQIDAQPVNLSVLVDEWLDDLAALPDAPEVKIEKQLPPDLYVAGERQYTSLIVQNLLENGRKYNRPGGDLRVVGRRNANEVVLTIGNSGRPIALAAQGHIFERFHRGSQTNQAVSGHGLGLNLARELARLHGGDLRLVRSENDWTEFEVCFPIARQESNNAAKSA